MLIVLHVDDEPDTLNLVRSILESEKFKVISAKNGKEGLEKLKKNKVDIVLLDVMMPDMSGWEVFKVITLDNKHPKVVFLSVIQISEDKRETLMKSGAADYITKPFNHKELVNRIKAIA